MMGKGHIPGTDPQPDHGNDADAHRAAAEAIVDAASDTPTKPGKPIAIDEEAVATQPAWALDPNQPGPPGWHKQPDPTEPSGFHWVED